MKKPEMDVIKFEANDIMTASGVTLYRISGLGDGVYNVSLGFEGKDPLYTATEEAHGLSSIQQLMGTLGLDGFTPVSHPEFQDNQKFLLLMTYGDNVVDSLVPAYKDNTELSKYNGLYTFENNIFAWYAN